MTILGNQWWALEFKLKGKHHTYECHQILPDQCNLGLYSRTKDGVNIAATRTEFALTWHW